jgi:hypothetical protein
MTTKTKTTLKLTKLATIFDKAKPIKKSEYGIKGILPTGKSKKRPASI